jgi:hypothetical protein
MDRTVAYGIEKRSGGCPNHAMARPTGVTSTYPCLIEGQCSSFTLRYQETVVSVNAARPAQDGGAWRYAGKNRRSEARSALG